MSDLIAIAYDDLYKAEEVRLTLAKLQQGRLIELEDAAIVTKDADGKVKLNQAVNLTATGAVGAASGAISGALTDIGVNDQFMKDLGATLQPGTSALFLLVRKVTPDKVLEQVAPYGGKVLQTSLTKDKEAELQQILTNRGITPTPAA